MSDSILKQAMFIVPAGAVVHELDEFAGVVAFAPGTLVITGSPNAIMLENVADARLLITLKDGRQLSGQLTGAAPASAQPAADGQPAAEAQPAQDSPLATRVHRTPEQRATEVDALAPLRPAWGDAAGTQARVIRVDHVSGGLGADDDETECDGRSCVTVAAGDGLRRAVIGRREALAIKRRLKRGETVMLDLKGR